MPFNRYKDLLQNTLSRYWPGRSLQRIGDWIGENTIKTLLLPQAKQTDQNWRQQVSGRGWTFMPPDAFPSWRLVWPCNYERLETYAEEGFSLFANIWGVILLGSTATGNVNRLCKRRRPEAHLPSDFDFLSKLSLTDIFGCQRPILYSLSCWEKI